MYRIKVDNIDNFYLTNKTFANKEDAEEYIERISKSIPCIIEFEQDELELLQFDFYNNESPVINSWNRENYNEFLEAQIRRIFYE